MYIYIALACLFVILFQIPVLVLMDLGVKSINLLHSSCGLISFQGSAFFQIHFYNTPSIVWDVPKIEKALQCDSLNFFHPPSNDRLRRTPGLNLLSHWGSITKHTHINHITSGKSFVALLKRMRGEVESDGSGLLASSCHTNTVNHTLLHVSTALGRSL